MSAEKKLTTPNTNVFLLYDREDEKQIVNPQDFADDKKLVYQVRESYELSWLGIKHLRLVMATQGHPLETISSDVDIKEVGGQKSWYATVKVKNPTTGLITEGVSEAPILGSDGKYDPFGRTKAHSKAERNAVRAQIPERYITKAIEEAKKKGQTKKLDLHQEAPQVVPSDYCNCISRIVINGKCQACKKPVKG